MNKKEYVDVVCDLRDFIDECNYNLNLESIVYDNSNPTISLDYVVSRLYECLFYFDED